MTWTCPTCDAMWNRHSLSARNPECHECQHEICGRCDSANCFTCGTILHVKCSVTVGNCESCGEYSDQLLEVRGLVPRLPPR